MKDYNGSINIRDIQHYVYCPHRFGLIEIDCNWIENYFVTKSKLIHKQVDNKDNFYFRGKYVEHSVNIFNDDWRIFGVIDCLNLVKDKNGSYVKKYDDKFRFEIIEYKPTNSKEEDCRYEDKMQILAQKICIDNTFNTNCDTYIYYANTKKKIKVCFIEEDYNFLKKIINEIIYYYENGIIPRKRKNQYCGGCSFKDICFPKVNKE